MLSIVLAEDLPAEAELISGYLRRYAKEENLQINLKTYTNGKDLTDQYTAGTNLVLLDIDMDRQDGISTARIIRRQDEQVQIVFVTRMVQYALEGYEVQAADFIIKPVSYELFREKIHRLLRRTILDQQSGKLLLKGAGSQLFVYSRDIIYAETSGRRVLVHLADTHADTALFTIALPLYQLEDQLPQGEFCRCHNAYLINLRYVTGYNQTDVFLGREMVPVSKHRRQAFVEALMSFHSTRS